MNRPCRTAWICFSAGLVLAGASLAPDAAQSATADELDGETLYLRYCAACHGVRADGKGSVAPALRRPPADLRGLWRSYGSPLAVESVTRFIDGRTRVVAHGEPDMPVWGRRLKEVGDLEEPLEIGIREALRAIVLYLDGIQEAPARK